MIKSIYFATPDSSPETDLSEKKILAALKNPDGLLWVSLEKTTLMEVNAILSGVFKFHPLAVEDCLSTGYQDPKIDDFGEYLFIIAQAAPVGSNPTLEDALELDLFLGPNYLVSSYRTDTMPPVAEIQKRISQDDRLIRDGSDFLCHGILDHLVDGYFPFIDHLDEEIDLLEDKVLKNPTPAVLTRILDLKHNTLYLRRLISPLREMVNRISRDEFSMIDARSKIYFRDIYDHLVRLQDLSESLRDIIAGVLDIYLNSTSLRLNEIMKALTIVSTIFLPLTFIAGVYGMNFEFMPEIPWRYGYLFVWILFLAVSIGMVLFFKKRKWF